MYNLRVLILGFILSIILTFSIVNSASASHKVFTENFDDGNLDGWVRIDDPDRTPCSAPWIVDPEGMAGISINQPSCTTNLMPSDALWNELGDNYTFELDMKFVQGTDHNIAFRFSPNSPSNDWYDLHFQSPGDFVLERINPGAYNTFVPGSYPNGNTYHLKIIVNENNMKVFINDVPVRDYTSNVDRFSTGRIALRAGTGGDPSSETYFDNIAVTSIDDIIDLPVPLLKQTNPLWGGLLYNSADEWAPFLTPPQPTDIARWGCALTSSVMLLRYHKITHLPGGADLNPKTLNDWFENTPKGYVNGGNVNWGKISKLSQLARPDNPDFLYHLLEFDPFAPATNAQLTTDLQNHQPDILGVNIDSHFVIATGILNTIFTINDPGYNRTLLSDYSNIFSSIKHFTPAGSDGSLIELFVNPSININVNDQNNNPVGGSFVEQPLASDPDGVVGGDPIKVYYVKKPASGQYFITLSSSNNQNYHLESDLFDTSAQDVTQDFYGVLSNQSTDTYIINFDHDNTQNDSITKVVTYESLINDINTLCNNGEIDNFGICRSLLSKAQNAFKLSVKDKKASNNVLSALLNDLNAQRGKHINENAYQTLSLDIQVLIANL